MPDELFDAAYQRLLAEADQGFAAEIERLGGSELGTVPERLANIHDQRDALILLAMVQDRLGAYWAEDGYHGWAVAHGQLPEPSVGYFNAHEELQRLGQTLRTSRPMRRSRASTTGSCSIDGCLIDATTEFTEGRKATKLCVAHLSIVDEVAGQGAP